MILSRTAILQAIEKGWLAVDPLDTGNIQAAHIDLRLSLDDDELVVPARGFVLAKTRERITLSGKLGGFIEGRAGLAKQGVAVEQSSTFIEPGSDAQMTLEISNCSDRPVTLKDGQPIAKLLLMRVVNTL